MPSERTEPAALIDSTIQEAVSSASGRTRYREAVIGFAAADDPRFAELRRLIGPKVLLPEDLLPGARTVVSFFLPFERSVIDANARTRSDVAEEWAIAYLDTNALLARIGTRLLERLGECGVRAAARPATGDFDRDTLVGAWSHKSAAVVAGIGSFGVHHLVITDAGCAGRLGSLVVDAVWPRSSGAVTERCAHRRDGGCLECVRRCPVGALRPDGAMDKARCWAMCQAAAKALSGLPGAHVCGKCAAGACAFMVPS